MQQCTNITADRSKGAYWERQFCVMAADIGYVFTPMQLGKQGSIVAYAKNGSQPWRTWTLPDVTIWTAPGQHHEIKHKSPTYDKCYGLEKYRFDRLLDFANITGQSVLYTIHNHALNGGSDNQLNDIKHWFTADILKLNRTWAKAANGKSWVNGEPKQVLIYYWDTALWTPLTEYWSLP